MKATKKLLTVLLFSPWVAFAQSGSPATGQDSAGAGPDTGALRPDTSTVQSEAVRSGPLPAEDDTAFIPAPGLPPLALPQSENGVKYLCGGVGENEEAMMKGSAPEYDMSLTFATSSGAYLADVDVSISDSRGNSVLEVTCGAPILMVDLPRAGTYKVQANTGGQTVNRVVRAGGKQPAHAVLIWPAGGFGDEVATLRTNR